MNQLYKHASDAMTAAYALAKATGRRVWRHTVEDKYGRVRWLISLDTDAHNSLEELAV